MSELASVQPAKPGSGDRAYSGLHGVWYTDRKAEPDTKPLEVFFAVTMRVVIAPNGEVVDPAIVAGYAEAMMQQFIDWHKEGIAILDPLSIRPDPVDQRPPAEQTSRKTYDNKPPAGSAQSAPKTTPDGKIVKSFVSVKVEKERDPKNKKTYIGFYAAGHNFPTVKVTQDQLDMWNKACNSLEEITGMAWRDAELGQTLSREMVCGYTESTKTKANGSPYMDFYGVRAK